MDIAVFITYVGLAVAVFIYITLWFLMAVYVKRIDIIDIAWGLGFIYIAILTLLITQQLDTVQLLAALFVTIWGTRLFLHIGTRLVRGKEDRRYAVYRKKWGNNFWQKTYTNIFLVQGLCMLFISSAVIAIITSQHAVNTVLVIAGFTIWGFGILFEAIADHQLRKFVQKILEKLWTKVYGSIVVIPITSGKSRLGWVLVLWQAVFQHGGGCWVLL